MKATLTLANHKVLSWNDYISKQTHWALKGATSKEIHQLVWFEANAQEIPLFQTLVGIKITSGKKSRPIDSDNICAKLYIDGLRACGVLLDDNPNYVATVSTRSVKSTSDWVEIEITDELI